MPNRPPPAFRPAGGLHFHVPRISRLFDRRDPYAARCRTLCGIDTIGTFRPGARPSCGRCVRLLAGRVRKRVEQLRRRSRRTGRSPGRPP